MSKHPSDVCRIEAAYDDEMLENERAAPVPYPDSSLDFMTNVVIDPVNAACWTKDGELTQWMVNARRNRPSDLLRDHVDPCIKPKSPTDGALLVSRRVGISSRAKSPSCVDASTITCSRPSP